MSKNQHQTSQPIVPKCRNCMSNRTPTIQNQLNPVHNNCSNTVNNPSDEAHISNRQNETTNLSSNTADINLHVAEDQLNTVEQKSNNSVGNSATNLAETSLQTSTNLNKKRNISSLHNQPSDLFLDPSNTANSLNRNACIIDRLSYLYLNESLADVFFIVSKRSNDSMSSSSSLKLTPTHDEQQSSLNPKQTFLNIERIPAHKLILSIGSQVFMAMFYGTGSQMSPAAEIEIPDVDSESFKHMLRYLYTDELHVEPDSVMSTLYVAKKYAIGALERECVDFLKNNLRPDNAFMLLEQALLFDETKLAELCLNLIDKNSCDAFSSECFLDIRLDTLILILKRDSLGIREFKLYYYVLKWAHNKCVKQNLLPINRENQKLVLGEAINLIRFPLMTREEFAIAMNDFDSRIIDDESIIDLFVNLTLSNNGLNSFATNSSFLPKKLVFNDTPRCCLGGKEQVINRFSQVESRWGYSGTSDRVRFTVNQRIFVVGFGLYGSIYGKCEYQAIIQLIHYDSCKTCAQNTTTFTCDGTNSTFRVYFKEPVEILADTDYIASATLKGPDSFYGTKGLRKVSHEIPSGGKVAFNFQYASGNNNGTSVEDGQIPEIIFLYSCS